MGDKVIRTYLNFNSYDFRHRKVMEILSSKPRNKTELVVVSGAATPNNQLCLEQKRCM